MLKGSNAYGVNPSPQRIAAGGVEEGPGRVVGSSGIEVRGLHRRVARPALETAAEGDLHTDLPCSPRTPSAGRRRRTFVDSSARIPGRLGRGWRRRRRRRRRWRWRRGGGGTGGGSGDGGAGATGEGAATGGGAAGVGGVGEVGVGEVGVGEVGGALAAGGPGTSGGAGAGAGADASDGGTACA